MPVIKIGREFGAGAETVGRLVAQHLKLEYLDNQILDEVARRLKVGTEVVETYDEKTGSLLDRILRQLATVDFSRTWPPGRRPTVTSLGSPASRSLSSPRRSSADRQILAAAPRQP